VIASVNNLKVKLLAKKTSSGAFQAARANVTQILLNATQISTWTNQDANVNACLNPAKILILCKEIRKLASVNASLVSAKATFIGIQRRVNVSADLLIARKGIPGTKKRVIANVLFKKIVRYLKKKIRIIIMHSTLKNVHANARRLRAMNSRILQETSGRVLKVI
jgi:hypothetical protein